MRTPLVLLEYPFYFSTGCFRLFPFFSIVLCFPSFRTPTFLFFVFTLISFHSFFLYFLLFSNLSTKALGGNHPQFSKTPLNIYPSLVLFHNHLPSFSPSFIPNNPHSYTPAFIFLIHLPPTTTTATTTVHSHRHSSLSHNPTDPYLHTRK